MLLKELKIIFQKELVSLYPKEEVDAFFYLLVEHYLKLERFVLVLHSEFILKEGEAAQFYQALSQLKKEKPIQYILGETQFMDLSLKINEHVLIPRPETEELVRWILDEEKFEYRHNSKILDIGTGSGCIAIALAKNLTHAEIYALDVSKEALTVANQNAELNDVQINFHHCDILDLNSLHNLQFDIIVSNPPYVRVSEKGEIQNNVKIHEPSAALFVSDEHPLKFYEAIVEFANNYLKPNGSLFFEINQYLANETEQLLVDNQFEEVELNKDIFGNFRFLKGKKNG